MNSIEKLMPFCLFLYIGTEAVFLKYFNKKSDIICCHKEDWIKIGKLRCALEAINISLSNNILGLKAIPEKSHLATVSLRGYFFVHQSACFDFRVISV